MFLHIKKKKLKKKKSQKLKNVMYDYIINTYIYNKFVFFIFIPLNNKKIKYQEIKKWDQKILIKAIIQYQN